MPFATFLHISDLHFAENCITTGSSGRVAGTKSHDFQAVQRLQAATRAIQIASREKFDLLIGTGDISTDGSEQSLRNAKEFIQEETFRCRQGRVLCDGLNMKPERCFIIPGNHDRYGGHLPAQGRSEMFETVFGRPRQGYPCVRGYRRSSVKNNGQEPALIFFLFDSTPSPFAGSPRLIQLLGHPIENLKRMAGKPARGRLEPGGVERMVNLSENILLKKEVEGFDGKPLPIDDYDNCIRIAVLHHHPVKVEKEILHTESVYDRTTWRSRLRNWAGTKVEAWVESASEKYGLTLMENDTLFIDGCFKAGIDIVLFGHEHVQYHRIESPTNMAAKSVLGKRQEDIHFFCCPSTFEYSCSRKGFYIFKFDGKNFSVLFYEWNKASFAEVKGNRNGVTWPMIQPYARTLSSSTAPIPEPFP